MIFDRLDNLCRYAEIFAHFDKISKFISDCAASAPAPGRYELDGDKLFANVQEYAPHAFTPEKLEYHRKYIDIQLLLAGSESIFFAGIEGLDESMAYSSEKDCGFKVLPAAANGADLALKPGVFSVFFPEEGHMPGVGDPSSKVIKVVIKIAVA